MQQSLNNQMSTTARIYCTHNNQVNERVRSTVVSVYLGLRYLQGAVSCISVPTPCVYNTHAVSYSVCSDENISLSIHFCL